MEQSQLIELISTLSNLEREEVQTYAELTSLISGKVKVQMLTLLRIILNGLERSIKPSYDKGQIFELLFPGQEYIEGKVEKVMVEVHKVVKNYLLMKYYFREENEFAMNFDFSEIVRQRNLQPRYNFQIGRLEKTLSTEKWINSQYFYNLYLLEKSKHDQKTVQNHVKGDLNIPNVLHALDSYYHLNNLAMLNFFLLQRRAANLPNPPDIEQKIKNYTINEELVAQYPIININYKIFNLLKKEDLSPEDANDLLSGLKAYENSFDPETLKEFFAYLRNVLTLTLATDITNSDLEITLHELFKDNLLRGHLHYEGKLHPSRYWAVSSNAIRIKKFDWAIEFIEKYKDELIGENETSDIYRLNKANYLFALGKFEECLDHIPPTFLYTDYLLHGKRIELKAHYELQSELLTFKLDSFKMFISRTSPKILSETQNQIHSDFANLLHQIVYSTPGDVKRSDLLVKRVHERKQAAEWRWLLEKAQELRHR